ncbi:MAG TPA: carboxypeptidase-like regulatory domain-containing protein [Kofleriaceae bacterium]|jgi:protocatechuate 3,4-dioxygenase beta subunit
MSRRRLAALAAAVIAALVIALWRRGGHDATHAPDGSDDAISTAAHGMREPRGLAKPRAVGSAAISGTIRDADGAPLGGIRVCGVPDNDAIPTKLLLPTCATSDAHGAYVLDRLLAADYAVHAMGKPYQPATYDRGLRIGPGVRRSGIDLAMYPGGAEVHGTVSDRGGGPIAHALVWACAWPAYGGASVETDARGAYSLWAMPANDGAICAGADGYLEVATYSLLPGTVDFALEPEAGITGTVVDGASGAPVAGVRVGAQELVGMFDMPIDASDLTDATGRYRLAVRAGRFTVVATAPHARGRAPGSVAAPLGDSVEAPVVRMFAAPDIVAHVVVHGTQEPCPDATLLLVDHDHDGADRALASDGDNAFRRDGVAPGTYSVLAYCPGFSPIPSEKFHVTDRDVEVTAEVVPGATIRGRILRGGTPASNVEVALVDEAHAASRGDGRYELGAVPPGTYSLVVDGDVQGPIVVGAADVTRDVSLEPHAAIEGEIVDEAGTPVRHPQVVDRDPHGETPQVHADETGRFRLDHAAPGEHCLAIHRANGDELPIPGVKDDCATPVHVTAGATAHVHVVVATATLRITGTVVDATGAPVTDAFVIARRRSGRFHLSDTDDAVLTAPDGSFAIERLVAGTYTVIAQRLGGADALTTAVAGASLRLQLGALGSISGTIAGTDSVTLQIRGPTRRTEQFPHAGGHYAMHDLPAGAYDVSASGDGGTATATAHLQLEAGEAKTLDLELSPP